MKRQSHIFQFSGQRIAEAAQAEYEYHKDRLVWWKTEQKSAIARAKEAGINVTEYAVTGGVNVNVTVDPSVVTRLNTCATKINTHNQKADRFQIEAAAYETQPTKSFDLEPDDIVYFRLAGGAREE